MAHNNVEIEIKLPLTKRQFGLIKKKLEKICKYLKYSNHKDDYYTPSYKSFLDQKYPYEWLTVRQRDGRTIFNYKYWYPEGVKYTTHCDEYQTGVEDMGQLSKILKALKFKKFITVAKRRLVFVYKEELEVVLDEVDGLGYFIEVETIKDFGSIGKARKEILKFTRSLGLTRTKTVPGGYAAELMRKKGLVH